METSADIISRFFDRAVRVSTGTIHGIAQFSKKLGKRKEMGVNLTGDRLSFTFIFRKDEVFNTQNYVYSKHFKITERGNYLLLQRNVEKNRNMVFFIKNMLALNSVILHKASLENGRYTFSFLFNSVNTPMVSDLILDFREKVDDFRLNYFGPSKPFFLNSEENKNMMVAVIRSTPPESETDDVNNPMGATWVRMVKMSYGSEKIDGVYLLSTDSNETRNTTEIIKGKMYSATTENRVLEYLTRRFTEELVVTNEQIHLFRDNNFYAYFTFQYLFRNNFVRIFNEVRKNFPDWYFSIQLLQNLYEFLESRNYLGLLNQ